MIDDRQPMTRDNPHRDRLFDSGMQGRRWRCRTPLASACFLLIALVVCVRWSSAQRPAALGDPLPGLTAVEFEEFRLGLEDFLEVEDAEEGLGPAFNGTSCAGCHSVPVIGGVAPITTVHAGVREPDGQFRQLEADRGSLFQLFSIPTHGCQSIIPPEANVIARRVPIPLFGAGLVEAIPDETIRALEDPLDLDRDDISGRASIVMDRATGEERVGRFGWKAQIATLLDFSGDAYRNEMGITNDLFPEELTFGLSALQLQLCDPVPDPEDIPELGTGRRGIDNFEAFMKFLGPPPRGPIARQVTAGEQVADAIGCFGCHVPALTTATSSNPLFDQRPVPLYSDLLLHDIGTGDGIPQERPRLRKFAHPPCGGCGSAAPCCTTAAPRRSSTRSCAMTTRRAWRGKGSRRSLPTAMPRCWPSSGRCDA